MLTFQDKGCAEVLKVRLGRDDIQLPGIVPEISGATVMGLPAEGTPPPVSGAVIFTVAATLCGDASEVTLNVAGLGIAEYVHTLPSVNLYSAEQPEAAPVAVRVK